jgi:hypothetical protein
MHIVCDLDPAHSERLRQLQQTWGQSVDQVIARLIDIGHTLEPENSAKASLPTDHGIAEYFGCLPDFPDREPQGDYENRQTLA